MRHKSIQTTLIVICLAILQINCEEEKNPIICTKCKCDKENKIIDCTYKKLEILFTKDDWDALKNQSGTDFPYTTIDLSHNSINNLTRFPTIPNVTVINLSYNNISAIEPRAFIDLAESLEKIDLSYNKIDSSILRSDVFEGKYDATTYEPMKNLKVLKLSSNELHNLDSVIFQHLPALEELYLNDNPFQKINKNTEVAFANIGKLRLLDLSGLELTKLPEDVFHAVRTLESLNLARNGLHHIPEALGDCINLKELNLDENPLNNLDVYNKFPKLPKLEKLSISYIQIMDSIGEGSLSELTGLKEFHAVHNFNLKEIHPAAFSHPGIDNPKIIEWPPVEKVFLHSNKLSYLDSLTFTNWESMKEIDLRHNPWECDCNNKWIIEEIVPKLVKQNETLTQSLDCAGPSQMHGKTLRELSEKKTQMRCPDKYGNHPERDGSILIGLLLGICIGVPFTLALIIFYKRGCFGLIRQRGPADFSRAYYQRAGVYDDTMHHI